MARSSRRNPGNPGFVNPDAEDYVPFAIKRERRGHKQARRLEWLAVGSLCILVAVILFDAAKNYADEPIVYLYPGSCAAVKEFTASDQFVWHDCGWQEGRQYRTEHVGLNWKPGR
jgi:hypothetical protein